MRIGCRVGVWVVSYVLMWDRLLVIPQWFLGSYASWVCDHLIIRHQSCLHAVAAFSKTPRGLKVIYQSFYIHFYWAKFPLGGMVMWVRLGSVCPGQFPLVSQYCSTQWRSDNSLLQLCVNSLCLVFSCFNMTMSPCKESGPESRPVHRVLNPILHESDLIATSVLDLSDAPVSEWEHIPTAWHVYTAAYAQMSTYFWTGCPLFKSLQINVQTLQRRWEGRDSCLSETNEPA